MISVSFIKVFISLSVIVSLSWITSADNDVQNRSKYKYGYVISHKGGSTQAHLESRDGNLALGRYYVNLQNGTGQKVTYFADDLGFHTGVSYSSQNGKGSSNTQIAVGQKALAALGNSNVVQSSATIARQPTLLFGKKILKTAFNTATPQPGIFPELNYTPVPGGFFLTHKSLEPSGGATERPSQVSQSIPIQENKHSGGISQSDTNSQTFYPTSENVKNVINEVRIESTTPSIKSYTLLPQQGLFSSTPNQGALFTQDHTVRVSSYATGLNDLSYSNQKSIEMTNFAGIDAQLISEVQKHAEGIILKDLHNNNAQEAARYSSVTFQPSTVTMQPIVVTNDGEIGLNTVLSTTPVPEPKKLGKNLQSDTINAVKTTGKNSDQILEDSGYFRVSLSPSLSSSINVSPTPHQSINVKSADRNSDSNNSTLCEFNLCEKDRDQIFSVDLSEVKPKKEIEDSGPFVSDISNGLGTNKIIRTFYPENKAHDERHYITTIDVQKAISLDINQNEANSIQFAQNFPFDKIKPFDQIQQSQPTPQPLISSQISITPTPLTPEANLNYLSTPQKPYISNTVTTAPGLFDVVPNQNLAVLQGLNDLNTNQYNSAFQDRVGTNRFEYENQLVVPPPPVDLTNQSNEQQQQQEELKQVQENIQTLRQQILEDIDAQHEEEQRKQNIVDQERKQYFQNLQKVEALKNQNSISYRFPVETPSSIIQATASPISSVDSVRNVELVPQTQYIAPPQLTYNSQPQTQLDQSQQTQYTLTQNSNFNQPQETQYETSGQTQFEQPPQTVFDSSPQTYKTEIKDFRHEVAVPQPNIQPIANLDVYQKPSLSYDSREIQTNSASQYNLYDTQNLYAVDNNLQQSSLEYATEKLPLNSYAPQVAPVAPVASIAAVAPVAQVAPVASVAQVTPVTSIGQAAPVAPLASVAQAAPIASVASIGQAAPVAPVASIAQAVPVTFQTRYAIPQVKNSPEKQGQTSVVNGQVVDLASKVLSQTARVSPGKSLVLNNVLPFDYGRFLQLEQPLSLLQTYPVSLQTESKIVPGIYPVSEQVSLPIQFSQAYKLTYPRVTDLGVSNKQYHSTLTKTATNKLRVQPLKPSTPDESGQREAVQNLLSQPQFHRTYYYPGFPINNRIQLRHISKKQISNSDQVRSQSIRRGKSLKNLRIEYGFKPPLRPSVEFSEEVKPSIYGSSVQPQ